MRKSCATNGGPSSENKAGVIELGEHKERVEYREAPKRPLVNLVSKTQNGRKVVRAEGAKCSAAKRSCRVGLSHLIPAGSRNPNERAKTLLMKERVRAGGGWGGGI